MQIGLILLFGGLGAEAQDDPARFLTVKKWIGTFTRSFNNTGHETDGGCTLQWNYADSAAITAHFEFDNPKPTIAQTWTIATIDSQQVQFNERLTRICPEPTGTTEWTARAADPPLLEPVTSLIWLNAQDETYGIAFPLLAAKWTLKDPSGTVGPQLTAVLFSTNIISLPLPDTGFALSGTLKLRPRDDLLGFSGWSSTLNSDVDVTWNIVPDVEDLEVVVEPEDYATWLPEGNWRSRNEVGNTMLVKARLQTKDGNTSQLKASRFYFHLREVSREPGVCMNLPPQAFADTNLDLRFDFFLNQAPFVAEDMDWIDDSTVRTYYDVSGYTEAEAMVASYDFGSYGKIKVTAEVAGRQIVGYLKGDPAKTPGEIRLPKRAENSHIADKWKEDNGVTELPDDDDLENDPVGDEHKGDGLTLYEEYRGFSENLKHFRANPRKKDLFIRDKIGNLRSKTGIEMLASQTGLEVHHEMRANELSSRLDLIDRWINFNISSDTPHVVDQHGVLLERGSVMGLSRAASTPEFDRWNSTPGSKQIVVIAPNLLAPTKKGEMIAGITELNRNGLRVLTDNLESTIAHELGHCCSIYHHGDVDKREIRWDVAFNAADTNTLFAVLEEGALNIVLKKEPDLRLLVRELPPGLEIGTNTIWLGEPQGEHSGVEDCFMRYDVAEAYPLRNSFNVRFWVKGDELTGIFLCNKEDGTGVNDSDWNPQSRYGDADRKHNRGNCKGQICVNDLYMSDAKHDRRIKPILPGP